MHPHEIHHIKAYIVFSIVSILCVWALIYLYFPTGMMKNLQSSAVKTETVPTINAPGTQSTGTIENVNDQNTVSWRRMRLTQILIRSQKELQALEDQRKSSPQWLDPVSEQKIVKLREKIASIEKMITEMK